MDKSTVLFKPATYIILAAYITLAYPVLAMGNKVIAAMLPEDHYFENVGAISLFVTSLLFFYGFSVARKSLDKSWIELNLHNLAILENSKFFTADRMFDVFWFLFGVLIPAIALLVPSFRRFAGKFIPIVYWGIGLLFLYNYLWAKAAKLIYKASYTFDKLSLTQATQEIKESNYAIIFILVALFAIWDLNKSKDASTALSKSGAPKIESAFHD